MFKDQTQVEPTYPKLLIPTLKYKKPFCQTSKNVGSYTRVFFCSCTTCERYNATGNLICTRLLLKAGIFWTFASSTPEGKTHRFP